MVLRTFGLAHQQRQAGLPVSSMGVLAATSLHVRNDPIRRYPIGTRGVDMAAALDAVRRGDEVPVPGRLGDLQLGVHDTWVGADKGMVHWEGDPKRPGALLLRTIHIPESDGRGRQAAFLYAVPLASGILQPLWKSSRLVAATVGEDRQLLIGGIRCMTGNDGNTVLGYQLFDPALDSYGYWEARSVPFNKDQRNPDHDRLMTLAAARCLDVFREASAQAQVLRLMQIGFDRQVDLVQQAGAAVWDDLLRPFQEEASILFAPRGAHAATDRYTLPHIANLQRLVHADLKKATSLSRTEQAERLGAYAELARRFDALMKNFQWEGKTLNRIEVMDLLRKEPDAATRAALYKAFVEHYGNAYREPGGLFETAARLSKLAGGSYADRVYRERFGTNTGHILDEAWAYFEKTASDARAYVDALRAVQRRLDPDSGDIIRMSDVGYLDSRLGNPDTEEPRLTKDQALDVLRAFYADLGIDFNQAPWNRIIMDFGKRPGKALAAGEALPLDAERAYFTMNIGENGVSFGELTTLVHEILHTIHFQSTHERAEGSMMVKDLLSGPQDWPEGIAVAVQNLLERPEVAQRYLGKYPGFTPEYFAARAETARLSIVWHRRLQFLIAMQEIMLYRDTLPRLVGSLSLDRRLALWNQWVPQVLFVEPPVGTVYGDWAPKPHFSSRDAHLYYAGYPWGAMQAERIVEGALFFDEYSVEAMRKFGPVLQKLLGMGSLITRTDIGQAGGAAH